MRRVLFEIGSFQVPSFGVLVMIGFLLGLWLLRRRAPRFGLTPDEVTDVAFWVLVSGVLGARIAFILIELPYYTKHPNEIYQLKFQGLTSFGGVILATVALIWQAKRRKIPTLVLLDCVAPSFLIGHIFGRIGCLLNGCCYGGHCDLPWGIAVDGGNGIPLPGKFHPAQAYDAMMNLVGFGIFQFFLDKRNLKPGQAVGFVLVVYGLARFAYEFWRAGTTSTTIGGSPLTEGHVFALGTAVIGAILWLRARSAPLTSSEVAP